MNIQEKPLAEVTRQAIEVLSKELGLVATLRFLSQFSAGYGDYTQEREVLFKDLTMDQALAAARKTAI
ncbi:MAG TPA: hypothetical protein VGS22_30510 [Thermoanaerobaculia bacterium]|jgi:hypothetical protein|nr:hypothetical protein [Thermoanaerobaculia bacterium]